MRPILLDVQPDEIEDLLDLQQWIRESNGLSHQVSRVPNPNPGQLGAAEILLVVLASTSTVELIRCLREWIRSRRRRIVVSVKNERGEVHITAENFDDDTTLVRAITRMIDHEQS